MPTATDRPTTRLIKSSLMSGWMPTAPPIDRLDVGVQRSRCKRDKVNEIAHPSPHAAVLMWPSVDRVLGFTRAADAPMPDHVG